MIDLHLADLLELRRGIGRSKEHTLFRLREDIGKTKIDHITREFLVDFAKRRAKSGAGPFTIGIDISFLGTVMEHAAAVHGIKVPTDQLRLGRIALHRLGLVAKSAERDRRPTDEELAQIIKTAADNPRQIIPLSRIIQFAVATALRQDEISRILWENLIRREPPCASGSASIRDSKPRTIRPSPSSPTPVTTPARSSSSKASAPANPPGSSSHTR